MSIKKKILFSSAYSIFCLFFISTFAIANDRVYLKNFSVAQNDTTTKPYPQKFTYPNITTNDLKTASVYELLLVSPGTHILRYTFTIDLPDGSIVSVPNYGAALSPITVTHMKAAEPGRIITFDNIVISENGKEKKIPSKLWYVVQ